MTTSASGPFPLPLGRPFGDAALLVDTEDQRAAHHVAHLVQQAARAGEVPGIEDAVVGARAVTVLLDPDTIDVGHAAQWLGAAWAATPPAPLAGPGPEDSGSGAIELPVRFDGPDLDEVAALARTSVAGVVGRLAEAELVVAFLGFSPGFAYLTGLPPELAELARRDRPRPGVPAGSVALGGGFAAVYPQATPGGWHLVGRTDAVLFDPATPPFALLRPGQLVRLRPTGSDVAPPSPLRRPPLSGSRPGFRVERGGACSLVEDRGRTGVASLGVPRAGAADALSAALVNRLLGNADDAAVVEVTVHGPQLRALVETFVCVIGDPAHPGLVEVRVDGHLVPDAAVVPLVAGQVLDVGSCGAVARAVLGVAGGFDTPVVLGSRSSDLLCGLGPAPLRPGDVLALGKPARPRGRLGAIGSASLRPAIAELRVLPGPDAPATFAESEVMRDEWVVSPQSDRVGTRLSRLEAVEANRVPTGRGVDAPGRAGDAEVRGSRSRGMVAGAVQLPSGGEAVVLGPDHATVGGYPVPAVVISADLPALAHLVPGARVRFVLVDHTEAAEARHDLARALEQALSGWFPTRAG